MLQKVSGQIGRYEGRGAGDFTPSPSSIAFMANSIALGTGYSPDSYLAICGRLCPIALPIPSESIRAVYASANWSLSIETRLYHGDTSSGKLIRLVRLRRFPQDEISGLLRCRSRMDN